MGKSNKKVIQLVKTISKVRFGAKVRTKKSMVWVKHIIFM